MPGPRRQCRIPAQAAGRRLIDSPCLAWPPLAHGLAFVLSLLSAVALLALGLSLRPAPVVVDWPVANAAEVAVVERFYAGLNQALAHGDHAVLDAVLAPDLTVALPGQPAGDRATLLAWLAELRHAAPGARVTLGDMVIGRNRAAARAAASGGQAQIAGAPVLGIATTWDASAFFELRDGQVVAYAPIAAPAPLAAALPEWRLPLAEKPQTLLLARLRLPQRSSQAEIHLLQWQLLLAENGTVQVDVAGSVQRSVLGPDGGRWQDVPQSAQALELRPGEALLIPPDAPLTLRPAASSPAVVLQVGVLPLAPEAARRPRTGQSAANLFASGAGLLLLADGASIEPLAEGVAPAGETKGGEAAVTVTRADLPPSSGLAPHPVAGGQLLAVEAGLLGVSVPAIGAVGADPDGDVLIRDGYSLTRGMAPRLRNAGGDRLELVVVTIDPSPPSSGEVVAPPAASTRSADEPFHPRYPSHAR
ncbi:MAG TPA: nuclear transport factor 2 family protein [Thermomicrobiales bacterium]|nr:nuclear transport factor 2 family protein [Thermomicrobiales bacterium]